MRSKCRVVTTAMLCMKNECNIQNLRFQFSVFAIRTEHQKDVFREGKSPLRITDKQRLIFTEMSVRMIGIYRNERKLRNHLNTLTKNILCGNIFCF